MKIFFLLLVINCFTVTTSFAKEGVALIIGNENYYYANSLDTTVNDAVAMRNLFSSLGMDINHTYQDLKSNDMNGVLESLQSKVHDNTVVFYYSGHGIQIDNKDYLLPVDIDASSGINGVIEKAWGLQKILNKIKSMEPRFVLAIVDACRNNPFSNTKSFSPQYSKQGLSGVNPREGMIVVYAAGTNQKAYTKLRHDEPSTNSLFTKEFIEEVHTSKDLDVVQIVQRVRTRVSQKAKNVGKRQSPAIYIQSDSFSLGRHGNDEGGQIQQQEGKLSKETIMQRKLLRQAECRISGKKC